MPHSRNIRRLTMIAATLLVTAFLAGPVLAHSAKQEIDALNAQWVAAFKAKDFATIESLMAPDSLLLAPGNPPIQGAESVVETWKAWGGLPNVKITFGAERVEAAASGDLAYDYGAYTFAFDSDKGPFAEEGKYIVVWKKIDGAWKVAADIFNNNSAP
ncbi:MAG: DUF4440 domain-containing protein [Alphaproteobacteria bacterium]